MRRRAVVMALLIPLLVLISPQMAQASATDLSVSGGFRQLGFQVTDSRTVGDLTFMSFTESDALTGDLSGTSTIVGECIVFASGEGMCKASETFTGTLDGRSGTLVFHDLIRIDVTTGSAEGSFQVLGGTGDLADVHGHGTFVGSGGSGTYEGSLVITG